MEPKQTPCPSHKIRHQDVFRRPIRLAGAVVRRCGNCVLRRLGGARPEAGQGEVALSVFAQTVSIPSSCVLWLNLCKWNPSRTRLPPADPVSLPQDSAPGRLPSTHPFGRSYGAPLRQLRASQTWRSKARSRSRRGRPRCVCPDGIHPFLLRFVAESLQMEPEPDSPQPDSAQGRPLFPIARLDFRRPIRPLDRS